MAWKTISQTPVYQNKFMEVTEDKVLTDEGDELTFGIVHKKPGVSIVPWDGERLTLVGQYRYPVDYFSYEFPAGHTEVLSDVAEAARAELEEEAGLIAKEMIEIGQFHVAPGNSDQTIHFFLATRLSKGKQQLEKAEKGMKIKKVTREELNQMIKDGVVKDSLTIAAMKFFELHMKS